MNGAPPDAKIARWAAWQKRCHVAGIAVLVLGLLGSLLLYLWMPDASGVPAGGIASGRQFDADVERIGGKATVWAVHFNQWFANLWHGKTLALTLAVLSVCAAMLCFKVADHLARVADHDAADEK